MIKKLVLIGPAFPLRGGIAHFNESFAKALQAESIEAEIVSFYLQYPNILFPGKTQYTEGNPPAGLKIHNLISSINPLSWHKAARATADMQPDCVVIRFWHPFMAPSLGTIARKLKKKGISVIAMVDNAIPHEQSFYDRSFLKYFTKGADAFFTLSDSVANDLKEVDPDKPVYTSPHPIYDVFGDKIDKQKAREALRIKSEEKLVLFFGFIRKYKGLDLLLEAMAKRGVQDLNIKLLVAGEFYEDKEGYIEKINALGLEDSVLIHDHYIPEEDVRNYFCAADIVAQTYITATQSGVTQIAYNFDVPMLVTDVGGLSEIVNDKVNGFVVPKDSQAIADALIRYFSENLEERFAENVRSEKHRFSWSFFTQKFLSFLNSL